MSCNKRSVRLAENTLGWGGPGLNFYMDSFCIPLGARLGLGRKLQEGKFQLTIRMIYRFNLLWPPRNRMGSQTLVTPFTTTGNLGHLPRAFRIMVVSCPF